MELILSPLEKALSTLKEVLDIYSNDSSNIIVRDSCIHRFEYCYELSLKTLKRFFKITEISSSKIEAIDFQSLIRLGSDKGLLQQGLDQWRLYREARNMTSHTYNQKKAEEVIKQIPAFYDDAMFLLEKLKSKNV